MVDAELVMAAPRIHIVGGPGSGKTTLSIRLARERGVEPLRLDDIAFDPSSGVAARLAERLSGVDSILAEPSWVTEGIYLGWTDRLFAEADVVIWLDLPMWVALTRKVPHHLRRTLAGGYPHAGMRNQLDHMRFMWRYYRSRAVADPTSEDDDKMTTRAETARVLTPLSAKVVRFQRTNEFKALSIPLG